MCSPPPPRRGSALGVGKGEEGGGGVGGGIAKNTAARPFSEVNTAETLRKRK